MVAFDVWKYVFYILSVAHIHEKRIDESNIVKFGKVYFKWNNLIQMF